MAQKRMAEAIWIESKKYWQCKVQRNGIRKAFTSSMPGRKGKHEAENKADDWLERGTEDMRFDAAWDIFIVDKRKHTSESNTKLLEWAGDKYLLPHLKTFKLSSIRPQHWQECIDNAVEAGLARRTCQNVRMAISTFLSFADLQNWDVNIVKTKQLTVSRDAPPPKEKNILQPKDINVLFNDPCIVHYGKKVPCFYINAWRFLVVTGLRRGELCGLRNDDFGNDSFTIRRSINTLGEETPGKTDNARRTQALSAIAKSIIEDQRAMLKRFGIISPWVFPDKYGERTNPNNLWKQWSTYAKQHDIHSTLHDLRHTFISINKIEMPLELLKAVVGHSAKMDTIGIYGHEVDGEKQRAAAIIDTMFSNIFEKVGGKVGG